MPLNRIHEEHDVGPELKRIYAEIRAAFDIPYVPSLFKVLAGEPEYLRRMWNDLGPVAASKEFHAASASLDEFIRSEAISGGWRFNDQEHQLAEQKISTTDMPVLGGVVGVFARALPRMAMFSRLMQIGYSGGQRGHISSGKPYPALSRMISVHVPTERDAGLRVWLLYAEIRRTTGARFIPDLFRVLSPFPGYLASSWMDAKRLLKDREFVAAKDRVTRRSQSLTVGMPVRDHRSSLRGMNPGEWREIEQTVDTFARLLPQFSLLSQVWRRSFATRPGTPRAA